MCSVLRGAILNRTYGTYKKTIYFAIFTDNIWSYSLVWSPVIVYLEVCTLGVPGYRISLNPFSTAVSFGDKPLRVEVICPQNGTVVLEGSR